MLLFKSLSLGGLAAAALALPAAAETVIVTIDGVHSANGMLLAQLCDSPVGYPESPCGHAVMVPAQKGRMTVTFNDVRPGTYALEAFQDEDGNFTFSLPTEGYAFSNDAPPPKTFADAAFEVKDKVTRQHVHMTYKSEE